MGFTKSVIPVQAEILKWLGSKCFKIPAFAAPRRALG